MKRFAYVGCVCVAGMFFFACGSSSAYPNKIIEADSSAVAAQSPDLGKADGDGRADRACQVVLREAGRYPGDDDYATDCQSGVCNYIWQGVVDVAEDIAEGTTVHVLYHLVSDSTWWQVDAWSQDGRPGFRSYSFAISEHLFGPDAGDAEDKAIELVAFLQLPDGSRLFDHNRFAGDFENHMLEADNYFVSQDGGVCQPPVGNIHFLASWDEYLGGQLRQGGYLDIHYDIQRLPHCRGTHNGFPAWDVVAYTKFLPGGQVFSGSLRELVTQHGQPTNEGVSKPFWVKIPQDAEEVEIWFHNFTGAGSNCQTWDSDYGRNYRFEVWPPADHPRCRDVEKDDPNIHSESDFMVHNQPACLDYDLAGQFDANHCEFFVEGFGNGHMGHYGIPFEWLLAYLRVGQLEGRVVNAGLFTRSSDAASGEVSLSYSLGFEQEPGLWRAGFAYHAGGAYHPGHKMVETFSFFIDVERPGGGVVRLWQSRQGRDYTWDDAFALSATVQFIPYGHIEWANQQAPVLESSRSCQ